MSKIDYKTEIMEKANILMQSADNQTRELGEDILDRCVKIDSSGRKYKAKGLHELLNWSLYHKMFNFLTDEAKNIVEEIQSLALQWYETFVSEGEFKRYCLFFEIRDEIGKLVDENFFSPEDCQFLKPLVAIFINRLLPLNEGLEYRVSGCQGYIDDFSRINVIFQIIREAISIFITYEPTGAPNQKGREIMSNVSRLLSEVYQSKHEECVEVREKSYEEVVKEFFLYFETSLRYGLKFDLDLIDQSYMERVDE